MEPFTLPTPDGRHSVSFGDGELNLPIAPQKGACRLPQPPRPTTPALRATWRVASGVPHVYGAIPCWGSSDPPEGRAFPRRTEYVQLARLPFITLGSHDSVDRRSTGHCESDCMNLRLPACLRMAVYVPGVHHSWFVNGIRPFSWYKGQRNAERDYVSCGPTQTPGVILNKVSAPQLNCCHSPVM